MSFNGDKWRTPRRGFLLFLGFATLIATSDVDPNLEVAKGQAVSGVRVQVTNARATSRSSLRLGGQDALLDSGDAGVFSGLDIRLAGSDEVIGSGRVDGWHALCPSLQDCTLDFEFDTVEGSEPFPVSVSIADGLEASGPICTKGEAFANSTTISLTALPTDAAPISGTTEP